LTPPHDRFSIRRIRTVIHIAEINDIQRLNELCLLWKSLWQRTRGASFFQSFDWMEAYWRHFGRHQSLKVLVATLAGKPIGILPLVVRQNESAFGPIRVLSYPLDDWGTVYGPIGPNSAATLVASMRYLRESRRDWDVIDLRHVDTDRLDRGRTQNAMRVTGMNCLARPALTSSIVDLQPNWNEYWAGRSVDVRRRFHDAERRLSQFGSLEHVRFRPASAACGDVECRWDLYGEFERLRRASNSPAIVGSAFLHDLHGPAVRAGSVDLNVLRLDGRPIAAAYGYHQNGRVDSVGFAATPGFGEDARQVLIARILRDGACRGDNTYQFTREIDSPASPWQTSEVQTTRLTHFAANAPRAQLLRLNRCVRNWLVAFGRGAAASSPRRPTKPMIPAPAVSC
jgi:CelD/BcsL family acetyltransferase involved in cellulose biosynthesis